MKWQSNLLSIFWTCWCNLSLGWQFNETGMQLGYKIRYKNLKLLTTQWNVDILKRHSLTPTVFLFHSHFSPERPSPPTWIIIVLLKWCAVLCVFLHTYRPSSRVISLKNNRVVSSTDLFPLFVLNEYVNYSPL